MKLHNVTELKKMLSPEQAAQADRDYKEFYVDRYEAWGNNQSCKTEETGQKTSWKVDPADF